MNTKFRNILIAGVVLLIIVVVCVFEIRARDSIKSDIEEKIAYVNNGNLNWVRLSKVSIAPELVENTMNNGENDIFTLFMINNEIDYKIGVAFPWGCKVSFYFNAYRFEDFISACGNNNIESYDEMLEYGHVYLDSTEKNEIGKVDLDYHLKDKRWLCDYNNELFLDYASCGILSVYEDYYSNSLHNINDLMEVVDDEED